MNDELLFVALFCIVPVIMFGLAVYGIIQRMYGFQEVLADGVETQAIVVRKYERTPSFALRHRITFEYRDASGRIHRKDEHVGPAIYHQLHEGSVIDVVYSAKRPHVWAFKDAVERSRAIAREQAQQRSRSDES